MSAARAALHSIPKLRRRAPQRPRRLRWPLTCHPPLPPSPSPPPPFPATSPRHFPRPPASFQVPTNPLPPSVPRAKGQNPKPAGAERRAAILRSPSAMASRRASNGRSPLVRKQSQITAFFSSSPTPSPSPSGPSPGASKPSPSPLNPSARTRSPLAAASPSLPKPQQKQKKGKKDKEECDAAAAVPAPLAAEVVGRRLRVYWPLDDAWYEGRVEAYDAASRRHRVKYDDGDEEEVDLGKEKFEWEAAVEDSTPPPPARKLRRLRRMSDTSVAKSPAAAEDSAGDSTEDEDWKRDTVVEDDSEEVELDEEDEEEVVAVRSRKGKPKNSLLMSGSTPSTLGSGLTSESG